MDSLVTIIKELWSCVSPHIILVTTLDSKVESLEGENKRLEDIYRDLSERVEQEELHPLRRRLEEVKGWLEKTQPVMQLASEMVENGKQQIQNKCLWGQCPKNCISSYRIARNIEKQLAEVKKTLAEGRFEVVTSLLPYHLAEVRPLENMVGYDWIFQNVWRWISDDNISIIGLYGMGGVGKTTLLTKINNELTKDGSSCSKLVIWVTVNKSGTVQSVQQAIQNRLNLEDKNWSQKTTDEKCTVIYQFLRGKEFVLLLDDLWEWLDLSRVGIPLLGPGTDERKKAKLVFTTRSKQVCSEMEAEKTIELKGLPISEAKALFNSKVGEETLNAHPETPHLAEAMTMYCGGLPVALVTIGRAMSSKTDPEAWRRALRFAKESRSKIASMESRVYPLLKLSYDSLSNGTIKQCSLYCGLFPQGFEIPRELLIRCWITEGMLHDEHANSHSKTSALEVYQSLLAYGFEKETSLPAYKPAVRQYTQHKKCSPFFKERDPYIGLPSLSTSMSDQGSEIIETLKSACLLEIGTRWNNTVKMHDVIHDMALWIIDQDKRKWIQSKALIEEISQRLNTQPESEELNEKVHQYIMKYKAKFDRTWSVSPGL